MKASPTACFFVKLKDKIALKREIYAHDIRILKKLGFEVTVTSTLSELRPADFYFIWWWTWAAFPMLLAKSLGRPALITGVFDAWFWDQRPRWHQFLHRFAFRHAGANVFISQLEYRQVPQLLHVNNPYYVPLAVDTDQYKPRDEEREDFIFTLAWLHRGNAERKCVPEIIKAAPLVHAVHPNVRFMIAGEGGDYHAQLVRMAREVGAADYLELPIMTDRTAIIRHMQRCKVYLQPSRFEGFGQAILEAMSCAAPVVSSPAGAVPEVVGDAAVLVDGTSPHAVADAVSRILSQDDRRRDLGRRARARVLECFSYARREADLLRIIKSLMHNHKLRLPCTI
jgi:glycosyltransferase involved in cell wall biosynthesis